MTEPLAAHVLRMKEEHRELKGRLDRLSEFVNSSTIYSTLPGRQKNLMTDQLYAMICYERVLSQRIEEATPVTSDDPFAPSVNAFIRGFMSPMEPEELLAFDGSDLQFRAKVRAGLARIKEYLDRMVAEVVEERGNEIVAAVREADAAAGHESVLDRAENALDRAEALLPRYTALQAAREAIIPTPQAARQDGE